MLSSTQRTLQISFAHSDWMSKELKIVLTGLTHGCISGNLFESALEFKVPAYNKEGVSHCPSVRINTCLRLNVQFKLKVNKTRLYCSHYRWQGNANWFLSYNHNFPKCFSSYHIKRHACRSSCNPKPPFKTAQQQQCPMVANLIRFFFF